MLKEHKWVILNSQIRPDQREKLQLLKKTSYKSQAALVREALDLLFRTPGGSDV